MRLQWAFGRFAVAQKAIVGLLCAAFAVPVLAQATPGPLAPPPATPALVAPTPTVVPVPASERPTAIVLLGADGTTYYRSGVRPATAEADKLAAVPWLTQRSPDALARVLPDGGGILVRRDRRAADDTVLQRLYLIKPAAGGGVVDEELPFDAAAFGAQNDLEGWRLRAISGLQVARGARRALLRLTFEKPAASVEAPPVTVPPVTVPPVTAQPVEAQPVTALAVEPVPETPLAVTPAQADTETADAALPVAAVTAVSVAAAPPVTREFLGWYDLDAKSFTVFFEEPRLVGAEISMDGRLIHVLAQRGAENSAPKALILDDAGHVKPTPVLDALRAVGYLYRGWMGGHSLLMKKAGQSQVVVYSATADLVDAPTALDVFAASKAPVGDFTLTWTGEPEDAEPTLVGPGGTVVPVDFEGPVAIAEWSADGRFALLLGERNERRQATKAWLLETEGKARLREIVLPGPVSAARFLYEAL